MAILVIRPTGGTAINLMPGGDPIVEDYHVDLGTLDLHEDEREEVAYSGGANVDGGEAISAHGPLTPAEFRVSVQGNGASAAAARAGMIRNADALRQAVANAKGGLLQYLPDELPSTYRSTYYHYEHSRPPALASKKGNNWDGPRLEGDPTYVAAVELDVFLQTQPYATSDPETPEEALATTTIYNQDDGQVGYVSVPAASVKGSVPALTQLRIRNKTSGAWGKIGKLWYARRKDPGANFDPILEGGTPDDASSIWWSTVVDTSRRSDNYLKYVPPEAANDQWAYRYFTISNITQHEGKAAVAVVVRSFGGLTDWDLKASLEVANVVTETEVKNVSKVGKWNVVILGELDIPPTPISDSETYDTKLYLYFRRTTGTSEIDLDFAMLLFADEYPQEITIEDGVALDESIFLENFEQELCHVVNAPTLDFQKTVEALCPLLQLEPGVANRIDFIWERLGDDILILSDDFSTYEAWWWLPVADFESDEAWWSLFGSADTVHYVEGAQGYGNVTAGLTVAYLILPVALDLSVEGRFGNSDFVYVAVYVADVTKLTGSVRVIFYTNYPPPNEDAFVYHWHKEELQNGWNFLLSRKDDIDHYYTLGGPDWSNITRLAIEFPNAAQDVQITYDDWRIVRADPNDAARGSDTGGIWDPVRDVWHIEEQESAEHVYGCIDNTAALEQVTLIHEEPPANIKYLAKVRAKRDNGEVGLVFRVEDGTSGSEDMAAFFIDTTNDQLELRKWAGGAASDIAAHVDQVSAPDTDYWLGVWLIGDHIMAYFGTSKAAIWDDENKNFLVAARKFNVTDADFASGGALAGGQAGLLSIGTLGRFDDVELYGVGDGQVPGDTVEVYLPVIYRTIYPFRE